VVRAPPRALGSLRFCNARAAHLAPRANRPQNRWQNRPLRSPRRDIRDTLIGLSLICHCAALAGADVPALFREAADTAGPAIATLYNEWGARYPEVQRIGSMGWKQVETEDGVGFSM